MIDIFYNKTDKLQSLLGTIDQQRARILLTPLSFPSLLHLQWQATLDRIYYSLVRDQSSLTKDHIAHLIATPTKKRYHKNDFDIFRYKNVLDQITYLWHGKQDSFLYEDFLSLLALLKIEKPRITEEEGKQLLAYIQAQDHPVLQSLVAFLTVSKLNLFPSQTQSKKIACLLAFLLLHKSGYDCLNLIVLEKCWSFDVLSVSTSMQSLTATNNITYFLEYLAEAFFYHTQKLSEHINLNQNSTSPLTIFSTLSQRQRDIYASLAAPEGKITNKQIQKLYNISQITASRDLAKLASLGLLISNGKGRSTYYTRA